MSLCQDGAWKGPAAETISKNPGPRQRSLASSQLVKILLMFEAVDKSFGPPGVGNDTEIAAADYVSIRVYHPLTAVEDIFHRRELILAQAHHCLVVRNAGSCACLQRRAMDLGFHPTGSNDGEFRVLDLCVQQFAHFDERDFRNRIRRKVDWGTVRAAAGEKQNARKCDRSCAPALQQFSRDLNLSREVDSD